MTGRGRVQAAVVGAGAWAPLHVEAIRRTGIGDVAVLVGRDPARARVAAARLAVEKAIVDVRVALEDPKVEVIHICTPNNSHAPLARAAIAAGKHVVVEKPIGVSAAEAREMAEAAGAARLHGLTAFTYRGYSTLQRFRKRVREGELEARIAAGYYLQDWLSRPSTNWRLDPTQGGPSLTVADIGVHWFDAVEFASNQRVEEVVANLAITRAGAQWGEDTASVLLRFDNRATGTVLLSQAFAGQQNAIRIDLAGDRASLTWELGLEGEESAVDALTNLFVPFYRSVQESQPPRPTEEVEYPTLWDGYRAARFVDAVLASAQSQTWASLDGKVSEGALRKPQS